MADSIVSGSSRYANAAAYTNKTGRSGQSVTLMGGGSGSLDILSIGRQSNGVGLSSRARQMNQEFVSSASSYGETIFSSSLSGMSSVEEMQMQIKALRAGMSDRQLSENLLIGGNVDETA